MHLSERRSRESKRGGFWFAAAALVVLAAAVGGCDEARRYPPAQGDAVSAGDGAAAVDAAGDVTAAVDATATAAFAAECHACHGSEDNPAPPRALPALVNGKYQRPTELTWRGIGAHQTHLRGTESNAAVPCEACHVVPTGIWDLAHMDSKEGRATITFGGKALLTGATPVYDPVTLTCSGVYCHGAKAKSPGPNSAPVWNIVDGTQRGCGSCHGAFPPAPHPQAGDCVNCHGDTAGPGHTIANKANHINGKVEIRLTVDAPCSACHGAPPTTKDHPKSNVCDGCHAGTAGPGPSIAHPEKHMNGKVEVVLSAAAPCDACHGAPPPASVKNHPQFGNCETCHAATAGPNHTIAHPENHRNGKVEVELAAGAPCAGCHGAPPPASVKNHPQSTLCETCHSLTAGPNLTIANPANHRNGKVEVAVISGAPCNGCHGDPPPATVKNHPQFANCEGCHALTAGPNHALAHPDKHMNGKTEVLVVNGAPCAACHGFPPQDKHPKLTDQMKHCNVCHAKTVDANDLLIENSAHNNGVTDFALAPTTCDACHAAPPQTAKHPPNVKLCQECHATTVGSDGKILGGGTHVNGAIDVALPTKCDACHGGGGSAAPPPDHNGLTDPTLPSVGAHVAHLFGKLYTKGGITCESCHVLPTTVDQPGHLFGTLQSLTFPSGLASWQNSVPVFDKKTMTCSNIYCHGATLPGGKATSPIWNKPGLACDACHATSTPGLGAHPDLDPVLGTKQCNQCHKGTVKADGTIDTSTGFHVNGGLFQ